MVAASDTRMILARPLLVSVSLALGIGSAVAQVAQPHDSAPPLVPRASPEMPQPGHGIMHLMATLSSENTPARSGVEWRIFEDAAQPDGTHRLVGHATDAQPTFALSDGRYIVHATYGFASAMKRVEIADRISTERLTLNAGAIEVAGTVGSTPIDPDKLSLSVYVPDHGNLEAKLVVEDAKPGSIVRLPEGMYHVVSTYLDTVGVGSLTPVSKTNSVVTAELRVQAGRLILATVKHRVAALTLKLVNGPGGEALANTSFTILTPGGDVIREMIGAFPSLVLAEGDYIAIARHDGKTYQAEFKVQSGVDRDVEVVAK